MSMFSRIGHQVQQAAINVRNQRAQRPRFGQMGIRASTAGVRPGMMQKFTTLTPRKK